MDSRNRGCFGWVWFPAAGLGDDCDFFDSVSVIVESMYGVHY